MLLADTRTAIKLCFATLVLAPIAWASPALSQIESNGGPLGLVGGSANAAAAANARAADAVGVSAGQNLAVVIVDESDLPLDEDGRSARDGRVVIAVPSRRIDVVKTQEFETQLNNERDAIAAAVADSGDPIDLELPGNSEAMPPRIDKLDPDPDRLTTPLKLPDLSGLAQESLTRSSLGVSQ